jgi:serine/threonine protein kinase
MPQVLGKGTYGIVMKRDYTDRKGNRYPAAFKKCNRDLSPDMEKKFDQEIETLRELKHLFVVKYIDVVVENDTESEK